jgi:hypothetical protein
MNKALNGYKNLLDNKPRSIYFIIILLWIAYFFIPNTIAKYEIPESGTLQIGDAIYTIADGEYVEVYNSNFVSILSYDNNLRIVGVNSPEMVQSVKISYIISFAMYFLPLILFIYLFIKKRYWMLNFFNIIVSIVSGIYISFFILLFPVTIVRYVPFIGYYLLYVMTLFSLINLLLNRVKRGNVAHKKIKLDIKPN